MSQPKAKGSSHQRWAQLRFSIVGPLLAAPPPRGELQAELERLAAKAWRHPVTEEPTRFGVSTIQRWYYQARRAQVDPVGALRRKARSDAGRVRAVSAEVARWVEAQYRAHPRWSWQLHFDNLEAALEAEAQLASYAMPSYSSLVRWMKAHALLPRRGGEARPGPGQQRAQERLEALEVRSFESEYVHGLWHLDFHHGSCKVLTPQGEWVRPLLLGILDDHSRLACHVQWYLAESAENLVHGLCQALAKRGLPRSLMTDLGAAMRAAETLAGLARLGIVHRPTLPYSPYQNGKQESFWGQVEGRLLAMLDNRADLSLAFLNQATQAWVEMEYQRRVHSEIGCPPLERYLHSPGVGRECPGLEELRLAFCQETTRRQRKSDGTLTLEGVRFEVPVRFGHFERVRLRYASWDLGHVYLVDSRTSKALARLYPLDRAANADGRRRRLGPPELPAQPQAGQSTAPLLRKLLEDYAATGLPPAYIPKNEEPEEEL